MPKIGFAHSASSSFSVELPKAEGAAFDKAARGASHATPELPKITTNVAQDHIGKASTAAERKKVFDEFIAANPEAVASRPKVRAGDHAYFREFSEGDKKFVVLHPDELHATSNLKFSGFKESEFGNRPIYEVVNPAKPGLSGKPQFRDFEGEAKWETHSAGAKPHSEPHGAEKPGAEKPGAAKPAAAAEPETHNTAKPTHTPAATPEAATAASTTSSSLFPDFSAAQSYFQNLLGGHNVSLNNLLALGAGGAAAMWLLSELQPSSSADQQSSYE